MNSQQQQQQGPSTPQRIFPQQAMNQGRPIVIANQQYTNRSFSPHTPSQGGQQQQQQQIIRTPIQLMQQQTKQISASPVNMMNQNQMGGSTKRIMVNPNNMNNGQGMTAAAQMEAMRSRAVMMKKKTKLKDKIIPQKVRELVPDSQSYMDLLAFERKLDSTIMRKRLDIQEALKRPMKTKKKLRVFITNQTYPGKTDTDADEDNIPQWELKIEGRLIEEPPKTENSNPQAPLNKPKPRKFSSFFKSLVIELDKDLYGPDNHLVEWHRTPQTAETDGFQVKRHGDQSLKCTILMLLDYQPPQFKLDPRLAKLLSIHTATRPTIIQSLWQYIKTHHLQDNQEKEFINLDKYLAQIFECDRIRFSDIPNKLHMHCMPPEPIVINHMINIETNEPKRTSIYDISVEIDDTLRDQMKNFLNASQSQSMLEVSQLDNKIQDQIEQINQQRLNRDFFTAFSDDPQDFINNWLVSQSHDLKSMAELNGNPEEERKAGFYTESWADEAVGRYFYNKVQQKRTELDQVLGIRS
jgi:SWI/SNF-related matrix-associated actin-dependent regulator of chromatin subfamily D